MNMKKIFFIAFASLFVLACNKNPYKHLNEQIKPEVLKTFKLKPKKYKELGTFISDTITVSDSLDILLPTITQLGEIELESYMNFRTMAFDDYNNDNYEEDVKSGKINDLRSREILEITALADSIIGNWDNIKKTDYDLIYSYWWLMRNSLLYSIDLYQDLSDFYNSSISFSRYIKYSEELRDTENLFEQVDNQIAEIIELRNDINQYNKLLEMPQDNVLFYEVTYDYSVFNPIFKSDIPSTVIARFNKDWQMIDFEEKVFGIF